jgi:hypothetical protein
MYLMDERSLAQLSYIYHGTKQAVSEYLASYTATLGEARINSVSFHVTA